MGVRSVPKKGLDNQSGGLAETAEIGLVAIHRVRDNVLHLLSDCAQDSSEDGGDHVLGALSAQGSHE